MFGCDAVQNVKCEKEDDSFSHFFAPHSQHAKSAIPYTVDLM